MNVRKVFTFEGSARSDFGHFSVRTSFEISGEESRWHIKVTDYQTPTSFYSLNNEGRITKREIERDLTSKLPEEIQIEAETTIRNQVKGLKHASKNLRISR